MKGFSFGSDLREAKGILDLTYMKILRMNLLILGGWPKAKKSSVLKNIYGWNVFAMNSTCCVTQTIYIKNNVHKMSFFELGHLYITMLMTSVVASRIVLVFTSKYHKTAANFLESLHLINHENKSEYAKETHILVHKISHIFTLYLYALMFIGLTLFNVVPVYTNYSKGMFGPDRPENSTFEHSVYHAVPFDYTTNFRGYLIMVLINFYISFMASSSFCTHDLHLSLMVFHVWGHIRILIFLLNNFPRPAGVEKVIGQDGRKVEMGAVKYSEEESKVVFAKLREAISHHNFILTFVSKMSKAFGANIFYYFTFHQVCGCMLLLECSQMDIHVLLRYGPLTFVIFQQLIQISIVFELLGISGENLEAAVYDLPWEYMDTKNRKVVYFMLCQSQRSLKLKALDMISIGVQTMIAILKNSLSYFVMLQTLTITDR